MKILMGGMNYKAHAPMLEALAKVSEVRCLDTGNADLIFDVGKDVFPNVLNKFSDDWQPDIVIWWIPEYNTIINKIEQSPYPVFVVVMDWNLGLAALRDNLKRFDWIFIDQAGVNTLNRAGFKNVSNWKICSFDPQLYKYHPELEKVYDVVFIGHFNHDVHRERSKWLKRLALLGDRYKIKILTGVYGEDNPRYINRSKICFNYSVRGEANLRTFEASACKTMVFIEDTNLEVKEFFRHQQECVYYNDSNFEQLIEYYINNDQEREKIAEAAYRKVLKEESYLEHFRQLLKIIKEQGLDTIKEFNRPFNNLDKLEKLYQNCLLLIQGISPGTPESAVKAGEKLVRIVKRKANSWNTLGFIFGDFLLNNGNPSIQDSLLINSFNAFSQATDLSPEAGLPFYNRSTLALLMGNHDLAKNELVKAFSLINSSQLESLFSCRDLFLPRLYDLFRVTWEKSTGLYIDNQELLLESYKNLLKWKVTEKLGDLALLQEDLAESLEWYNISISSMGEISEIVRIKKADLLTKMGRQAEATEDFKIAGKYFPFDTFIWKSLAGLLFENKQYKQCSDYCNELMTVINSCPFYETELEWLEPLKEKIGKISF